MKALTLRPDGVAAVVELPDSDATATLRGLYAQIGGRYVQPVRLAADLVMWVDEDGLLTEHPVINRAAGDLGGVFDSRHVYVGTVVYTGAVRPGSTRGLSDERIAWLLGWFESAGVGGVGVRGPGPAPPVCTCRIHRAGISHQMPVPDHACPVHGGR